MAGSVLLPYMPIAQEHHPTLVKVVFFFGAAHHFSFVSLQIEKSKQTKESSGLGRHSVWRRGCSSPHRVNEVQSHILQDSLLRAQRS